MMRIAQRRPRPSGRRETVASAVYLLVLLEVSWKIGSISHSSLIRAGYDAPLSPSPFIVGPICLYLHLSPSPLLIIALPSSTHPPTSFSRSTFSPLDLLRAWTVQASARLRNAVRILFSVHSVLSQTIHRRIQGLFETHIERLARSTRGPEVRAAPCHRMQLGATGGTAGSVTTH